MYEKKGLDMIHDGYSEDYLDDLLEPYLYYLIHMAVEAAARR